MGQDWAFHISGVEGHLEMVWLQSWLLGFWFVFLGWGFGFSFCKTRMCPVLIGIVIDFHKKPRPEPFVKYQFGQHAFLPCWHRQKGNCAGPRACSAPAGWCSTYHDLGFFSAGNGKAAVDQRKLWAVQNACKWSTCRLLRLFAARLWIELCLSFTRWRNRMVWLMMSCRTAGSVQSATMQGKLEKWV